MYVNIIVETICIDEILSLCGLENAKIHVDNAPCFLHTFHSNHVQPKSNLCE